MKVVYEYSHLGGSEILKVRYPDLEREIYEVIALVKASRTKVSEEKTSMGVLLYDPADMNKQFEKHFRARKFDKLLDSFTIAIPGWPTEIAGAYKEVDFVKGKVHVEVQFGKYIFMSYDLTKFQYFFNENKADLGVEIVPCHALKKEMSTGVSYGEQLVYDIERLKRHFPAVPVKIILVDVDDRDTSATPRKRGKTRAIPSIGKDTTLDSAKREA